MILKIVVGCCKLVYRMYFTISVFNVLHVVPGTCICNVDPVGK